MAATLLTWKFGKIILNPIKYANNILSLQSANEPQLNTVSKRRAAANFCRFYSTPPPEKTADAADTKNLLANVLMHPKIGQRRSIKDKVAVVTGGAEGIGFEIVKAYVKAGTKMVVILDNNDKLGKKAAAKISKKYGGGKTCFMLCDITKDLEEVSKKIYDNYCNVDILVNNAGLVDETNMKKVLDVNLIALMKWSMVFFNRMRKDKGGCGGTIINVSSIYGYTVDPWLVYYKTTKFAIMGFTRTLGHPLNYGIFGVRVMSINPGFTTTTLTNEIKGWKEHAAQFKQFVAKQPFQPAAICGTAAVYVYECGHSGSAWKVYDGRITEIPLVKEGDQLR